MKMFRVTSNDLRHREIREIKDRMCESPGCWLEPSELRTPNHLIFKKCSQMSKPGKVREDKIRFLPLNDGKPCVQMMTSLERVGMKIKLGREGMSLSA